MKVLVLGSGPTGLLTGAALAARGHEVTSVDRDPGPAEDGTWQRRGVMQFEHAHGFRPQVTDVLQRRWPAAALNLGQTLSTERICEAAQADPRINDYAGPYFAMTDLPACLRAAEPLARAVHESGWRAPYAAGPTRDELVDLIRGAVAADL